MALATSCRIVVLPAFGGDTISARCPLPIGMMRSITRVVSFFWSVSNRSRWFGYSGVSLANSGRALASSGVMPLTVSTRANGANFCRLRPRPCCGRLDPSSRTLICPVTASPRRMPWDRTMFMDTYTSFGPDWYPDVRMNAVLLSTTSRMPAIGWKVSPSRSWFGFWLSRLSRLRRLRRLPRLLRSLRLLRPPRSFRLSRSLRLLRPPRWSWLLRPPRPLWSLLSPKLSSLWP